MLAKMCGWNEPEKPQEHRHIHHMLVDAALIQELKAGHAELLARRMGEPKLIAPSVPVNVRRMGAP